VEFKEVLVYVGGVANAKLSVPCGPWDCIGAKDELHTLRRTISLGVSETRFFADFTGTNRLICGDANNDNVVDINDYGRLFAQYLSQLPPDTDCSQVAPPQFHTDFTCDGTVNTSDFLCILFNFLKFGDESDACCPAGADTVGGLATVDGSEKPVARRSEDRGSSRNKRLFRATSARTSISVDEIAHSIGMDAAMAADMDGNGVLDVADMALFSQGNNIELPERFQEIMLKRATPIDNVPPVVPRR